MALRHFKALMKKNWINWKRTLCASLTELICPIVLMSIIALLRGLLESQEIPAKQLLDEASALYPPIYRDGIYSNDTSLNFYDSYMQNQILYDSVSSSQQIPLRKSNCDKGFTDNPCPEYSENFLMNSAFFKFMNTKCNVKQALKNRLDSENDEEIAAVNSFYVGIVNDNKIAADLKDEIRNLYQIQIQAASAYNGKVAMQKQKDPKSKTYRQYSDPPLELKFKNFQSKEEINKYVTDPLLGTTEDYPGLCFAVIIDGDQTSGYDFQLMFNNELADNRNRQIPSQNKKSIDPLVNNADLDSYGSYTEDGFAHVHNWLANFVLRQKFPGKSGGKIPTIGILAVPMKTGASVEDDFAPVFGLISFFVTLMYLIPVYRITFRIVSEKESRARESMKMMGLTDASYWLSWFTYYFLLVTTISVVITVVLNNAKVIKYSSAFLFFIYLWLFGISLFGIVMMTQPFFNRARTAGLVAQMAFFFLGYFDSLVRDPTAPRGAKVFLSLIPTVALTRATEVFAAYETSGTGQSWENLYQVYNNYSFGDGLTMMFVSFIIFVNLGIYFDNVVQQQFGTAKHPLYFIDKEYWSPSKSASRKKVQASVGDGSAEDSSHEAFYLDRKNYEAVNRPELLNQEKEQRILKVHGLKKNFKDFQAVDGVNLTMYQGQIFALLGHNGAGKTTTISMLTGLIPPSEGQAQIFDKDLFTQMGEVRKEMGVCPQHDILFDLLTPREHLDVFCDFKGVDPKEKKAEIEKVIEDIDIGAKANAQAKSLSGGNRRKLSVAIALVGGSKFVLLDEPTSGMDLSTRRKLWDMLKKYKSNRIIILTTHYMDEADILGDRVGIMSTGKITCLGSPLFLKNRFGVGYNLTMVKKTKRMSNVGSYLEQHLGPEVKKLSEVSSEITYQIPKIYSHKFQEFFNKFDQELNNHDILSYGISVTTLEEVFLRVGHGIDEQPDQSKFEESPEKKKESEGNKDPWEMELDKFSIANLPLEQSMGQVCAQTGAVLKRRVQSYKQNMGALITEVFVPVILLCVGMAFSKVQFFKDAAPRAITPALFETKQIVYLNSDNMLSTQYDIKPSALIEAFPDYPEKFEIETIQTSKSISSTVPTDRAKALSEFDLTIYEKRVEEAPYRYLGYYVLESNNYTKQFKIASLMNITSQDILPISTQLMYEAILKEATGNKEFKFKVTNTPFPVTQRLRDREVSSGAISICFVVGIGFALIPAGMISFVVYEREKELKQAQVAAGLNLFSYMMANMLFDIVKALIPCLMGIALIYIFNMGYEDTWATILIYPFGCAGFTYLTSYAFGTEQSAQSITLFTHIIFGAIGGMAIFILLLIPGTASTGDQIKWYFKLIPTFSISNTIIYDSSRISFNSTRTLYQNVGYDVKNITLEGFDFDNIGGDVFFLGMHFVVAIIFIFVLEMGLLNFLTGCSLRRSRKPIEQKDIDDDVLAEEKRVASLKPEEALIRVNNFRKEYKSMCGKPVVAVEKTSFAVDKGECFALLGVNGAGKTSTFKSLTKGVEATAGEVTIMGYNVKNQFNKARKFIGYCPQYDTIFDLLTVEQHLKYYCVIKNIPEKYRASLIERQLERLRLTIYRDKLAGTLSGGNKRKLSVALALLGNPPVILLDEPSAGMDPEARRFMWGVVARASQETKHSGVIITTHSMEEAEALSTKMGIQVKGGVFKCFGSTQHIKNKFGTGYEIEVKLATLNNEELTAMRQKIGLTLGQERLNLQDVVNQMQGAGIDSSLLKELTPTGTGQDLANENIERGDVPITACLQWLHAETFGIAFIQFLAREFQEVEILEHYSNYFKLRVPKGNTTIGYAFGIIEEAKLNFRISEYSASQTTLEQIFQSFAKVSVESGTIVKKTIFKAANKDTNSKVTMTTSVPGENPITVDCAISDWCEKLRNTLKDLQMPKDEEKQ